MSDTADLELVLHKLDEGKYTLWFNFILPGQKTNNNLGLTEPVPVTFDFARLRQSLDDSAIYGECLAGCLFADRRAAMVFDRARSRAGERPLRVRINLASAPDLQSLRWETMHLADIDHPRPEPLFLNDRLLFSRFLPSRRSDPLLAPERPRLRALVMIANPSGLPGNMAPIEVAEELRQAREGLQGFEIFELAKPGQATLNHLLEALRDGIDVLYLVAHGGKNREKQFTVLLEDSEAGPDPVSVDDLVRKLPERNLPMLAVLISCLSSGSGDGIQENPLQALAPRLVDFGIPAGIGMQGRISFDTMTDFLPTFFRDLQRHWQLDTAISSARSRVSQRHDWWMPVLYSRLIDNSLPQPAQGARPILDRKHFEPETVYVPGGPFTMGRDAGEEVEPYETPAHLVDLPAFRIGKYPVTNAQFAEFVRQSEVKVLVSIEAGWNGQSPPPDKLNHPVVGVTWYQALLYCQWLSSVTGRNYSLPSEAQWEKAARGPKNTLYPWGDEWEEGRCNVIAKPITPVDKFPPQNDYGCFDMVGNTREWTCSLWGDNRREPDELYRYPWKGEMHNDLNANMLVRRVFRSGVGRSPLRMTCTSRNSFAPDKTGPADERHGFRVVLAI